MKKTILVVLIVAVLISIAPIVKAEYADRGTDKYNPTNLEWIVMDLNSRNTWRDIKSHKFSIAFYAKRPGTVVIDVNYLPGVSEDFMNDIVNSKEDHLKKLAKIKSWDWLKIEKDIRILESKERDRLRNLLAAE